MASEPISPADRIRELAAINSEVADMVQSASQAVNALTNRPLSKPTDDGNVTMANLNDNPTLDDRKDAFTEQTKAFYTNVGSVFARLRNQAHALEKAGIISPEKTSLSTMNQSMDTSQARQDMQASLGRGSRVATNPQKSEQITNGGLGKLDVGWLNSRANKVGADKESELIADVKKLLDQSLAHLKSDETG